MAGIETEAVLSEAARHLQAALDALDGSVPNIVLVARVSHLLEDVRLEIAELRIAHATPGARLQDGAPLRAR